MSAINWDPHSKFILNFVSRFKILNSSVAPIKQCLTTRVTQNPGVQQNSFRVSRKIVKNFKLPRKILKRLSKCCGNICLTIGNTGIMTVHYKVPLCVLTFKGLSRWWLGGGVSSGNEKLIQGFLHKTNLGRNWQSSFD